MEGGQHFVDVFQPWNVGPFLLHFRNFHFLVLFHRILAILIRMRVLQLHMNRERLLISVDSNSYPDQSRQNSTLFYHVYSGKQEQETLMQSCLGARNR